MTTDPLLPPASTPTDPLLPPASTPTDPLSGAMLTQLSQNADGTTGTPGQGGVPLTGSMGKESLSGGLPLSTEIPLSAVSSRSGALEGGNTLTPEVGPPSSGSLEAAPAKELEPEVEATQEKIAQQKIQAFQETVVAADTMPTVQPITVSQPVVVLPLSEKGMQLGQKKSTQQSIRWLYEWCVRQIRKFSDTLVVYRDKD